ncbi:MAG: UbiA family prenyltransferase [Planctomycetes bacterium]|nr:UbiA family prenyltransferase [Planctomycetota bacterium]
MGHWLRLLRPFTLLPPILGMATGAAAAWGALETSMLSRGRIGTVILGMVMAATLNAASNVLNQIHDLAQDRVNKPDRPLPSGALSLRCARISAATLYSAALAMAWFVDVGAGHECFVIVVFTVFLTWAYSGPPLRWRRFGWRANLTIAIPRGWLLKVAGWSTVAPVFSNPEPWYLGFIFFLFLLGATTTKDFADMAGDAQEGVRNLPVRLGASRAVAIIAPFFWLPWLFLPLGAVLPGPPLSASPIGLTILGLVCAAYGAWVHRLLARDTTRLVQDGENHPAWRHMYGLMMLAQLGSAAVYLI